MRSRIMIAAVLVILLSWKHGVADGPADSVHLLFGLPTKATSDPANKNDFLIVNKHFAISYNESTGTPNWVSWRLQQSDLGHAPRGTFHPDQTLPHGFTPVKPSDYQFALTGMTRGHMCPHSDRSNNTEASKSTFVMTNMVPQSLELNAGAWNDLEIFLRDRVKDGHKEAYIIAGPSGKGGRSSHGHFNTTNGRVVVPDKCWKVALLVDVGATAPMNQTEDNTNIIAALMPNSREPEDKKWFQYRVKLTDVEELTGFKFFEKASPAVMTHLRSLTPVEAAGLH